MKIRLLVFLTIFLTLLLSCSDSAEEEERAKILAEMEPDCACIDTSIVNAYRHKSPFDSVSKIVSYQFADTVNSYFDKGAYMNDSGLVLRKYIVSVIDITHQKNNLEKIIFNKVERCSPQPDGASSSMKMCIYQPHHCIIFYDINKRARNYLELCFTCEDLRANFKTGPFCGNTYCKLRTLFKIAGHDTTALWLDLCK